jgi:hypothetical protein
MYLNLNNQIILEINKLSYSSLANLLIELIIALQSYN